MSKRLINQPTLFDSEIPIVSKARIQREQKISEAEGYLDLIIAGGDICALEESIQHDLANRALETLESLDESSGRRSHVHYLQGLAHRFCDRFDEAITSFEQAMEYDSNGIHIFLSLGWCYKRAGRIDEAINSLEDALDVEPSSGIVNYNLACYWALAGNVDTAVRFLSRAFDLDNRFRDLIGKEKDFDSIRNHPAFLAITTVIV